MEHLIIMVEIISRNSEVYPRWFITFIRTDETLSLLIKQNKSLNIFVENSIGKSLKTFG